MESWASNKDIQHWKFCEGNCKLYQMCKYSVGDKIKYKKGNVGRAVNEAQLLGWNHSIGMQECVITSH